MPDYHLSDQEANALAAYLSTHIDAVRFPPLSEREAPTEQQLAEGKQLFAGYQCLGCHVLGAECARIGPELSHVGARLKPEYLDVFLADPQAIIAGTAMKDFQLWEDERVALVAYLESQK